jgi:hypothetical protein
LLDSAFASAHAAGLIDARPEGAVDATGLETRHVSAYYVRRRGHKRHRRLRWPKQTLVTHTATHLFAAVVAGEGPSQDSPDFTPAMREASSRLRFDRLLADSGYDGEHNHVLAREELGVRSTVIKLNPRNTGRRWPKTKYRRQMKRRFHKRKYGQRWQAESAISRNKRRLGSALRSRTGVAQENEMHLRVFTHDVMVLAAYG